MRRIPVKAGIIFFLLVIALGLIGYEADAAWIRGVSSNFDLHNFTGAEVNDLELILGGVSANDVVRLYAGELARGWIPSVEEGDGEVRITWKAPGESYLEPREWLHLGLSLRPGAPYVEYAKATWTLDGEPVGTIAFVWQNWDGNPDSGVADIIIPPAVFPAVPPTGEPDTLIVERRWAVADEIVPLNNLTSEDPLVRSLKWSEQPFVDKLTPNSRPSSMIVDWPPEGIEAVLVQYTVTLESTGNVEAVFTNEARIVHDPRPQPRIVKPVDNLGERPDLIYGTVNLWATEATGLWDDQIVLTRFEFSGDDGQRWQLIGEDDDGTVPTLTPTRGTNQHNWWQVQWNTSDYNEGLYLVKATMTDQDKNVGEEIIAVYIDPTPPVPILDRLQDHQVFMDPTEISCHTLDEDVVSIIWEVQLKVLNYVKGIPHLDQHDYGVGQAANGNNYCAPTGSAACLKWWAAHGYPKLTQDPDGNPLTDTQLVEGLADDMGTVSTSGTSGAGIVNGLRQWIQDRGLLMSVKEHATINPTTIRDEVENCKEDVILGILWNTGGGHIVTVNSIANFTNADGTTNIDVMDPWVGGVVDITMEADGDIHWPGKAGVQTSGLLVSVSPIKLQVIPVPWMVIGEGQAIAWDPRELSPGLYFVRATMTDAMGNRISSQIVARVGQPLLPVDLVNQGQGTECQFDLVWQETEAGAGPFVYTVEYTESLEKRNWEPVPGTQWPISATRWSEYMCDLRHRYYRVKKERVPK